jgi:hypothetical protein
MVVSVIGTLHRTISGDSEANATKILIQKTHHIPSISLEDVT